MKKILIIILIIIFGSILYYFVNNSDDSNEIRCCASGTVTPEGANNPEYAFTQKFKCNTPEGVVGDYKRVVEDSQCSQNTETTAVVDKKYSLQEISDLGEKLATWGNSFGTLIFINGEPVVSSGPNSGGRSPVIWHSYDPDSSWDYAGNSLYLNIEKSLMSSSCAQDFAENYIKQTMPRRYDDSGVLIEAVPSDERKFAKDLSCLGKITFSKTFFGQE